METKYKKTETTTRDKCKSAAILYPLLNLGIFVFINAAVVIYLNSFNLMFFALFTVIYALDTLVKFFINYAGFSFFFKPMTTKNVVIAIFLNLFASPVVIINTIMSLSMPPMPDAWIHITLFISYVVISGVIEPILLNHLNHKNKIFFKQ